jgi:hypothetical protein
MVEIKRTTQKLTFMSTCFDYIVYVDIEGCALGRHVLTTSFMLTLRIAHFC